LGGFGQALDGGETDADACETSGAVDGDDGGEVAQVEVALGKEIGDGGDEGGGVAAAFEFDLAHDLKLAVIEPSEGYGARGAAGVDGQQELGGRVMGFRLWRSGGHHTSA